MKRSLPVPVIHDESLRYVTRGNDFFVNCSVDIDSSITFILRWITPKHVSFRHHHITEDRMISFSSLYLFDYNIYITCVYFYSWRIVREKVPKSSVKDYT